MNWENQDPTSEPAVNTAVLAELDKLAGLAEEKGGETGSAPPEGEAEGEKEGKAEGKEEGGEKTAEPAEEKKEAPEKQAPAEEKKKEEPAPAVDLTPFKEFVPDAATMDDVVAKWKQDREDLAASESANNELVELFDKHPEVVKILKDVRNGIPTVEAAAKHLDLAAPPPDPKEDPEGYKTFVKRQTEREHREKQEALEAKKAKEQEERIRDWGRQKADEFRRAKALPDNEMKAFGEFVAVLIQGDPATGLPPADYFERMWAAYRYNRDVQKAKEEGRIEGRNEIAEKVVKGRQTKVGDRLPTILPGGQQPKPNDSLTELHNSIKSQRKIFS